MKQAILKLILAILNILCLGLGFALTRHLKKAVILLFCAYGLFAFGAITRLFAFFYGFIAIYLLIFAVFVYAFASSFLLKEISLEGWKINLLKYFVILILLKIICVLPVREHLFEPRKSGNLYVMTDKANNSLPLYIFWSGDPSQIGEDISDNKKGSQN